MEHGVTVTGLALSLLEASPSTPDVSSLLIREEARRGPVVMGTHYEVIGARVLMVPDNAADAVAKVGVLELPIGAVGR